MRFSITFTQLLELMATALKTCECIPSGPILLPYASQGLFVNSHTVAHPHCRSAGLSPACTN